MISGSPATYGISVPQATAYSAASDAFIAAYTLANAEATRSPTNIVAKDDAKAALKANARMLARIIQANPSVTNEQKSALGLTVRDVEPSPNPKPDVAPVVKVVEVNGRVVSIEIEDPENPDSRGRRPGTTGVSILSYVGPTAPEDPGLFKFEGTVSRTQLDVIFPITVPAGAKVWISASWFNARGNGPACAPVGTNLQFGGEMPMAA